MLGLGSFSFFCFLHLVLSIIALALFLFLLKNFESFGFFFMPPSFVWALSIVEVFHAPKSYLGTFIVEDFLCPPVLFGHFQSLRIFSTCPPV
jgi:hypothetical protein